MASRTIATIVWSHWFLPLNFSASLVGLLFNGRQDISLSANTFQRVYKFCIGIGVGSLYEMKGHSLREVGRRLM